MRRTFANLGLVVLSGLASGLTGCSTGVHGVTVNNSTDRIVRVELMQLRKDGEMTAYSTQTVGPGGEFKHMVDDEERRPGMRARFTLADQKPEEGNWVMLNMPKDRDRAYDLRLLGSRLTAQEQTKNRKLKNPD